MQNVRILWKYCNLQNFFIGNNKNNKLMKVSFPILTYYFLKKGVVTQKQVESSFIYVD